MIVLIGILSVCLFASLLVNVIQFYSKRKLINEYENWEEKTEQKIQEMFDTNKELDKYITELEEYKTKLEEWLTEIGRRIKQVNSDINHIDNEGLFKSHDTVGAMFGLIDDSVRWLTNIGIVSDELKIGGVNENRYKTQEEEEE